MTSPLFAPTRIGDLPLPNRIVMPPLTRARAAQPGNVPTAMNAAYYAQRASAGLIIAEATDISADAKGYSLTPGVHSAAQIAGWKLVTDAVHRQGGRIFLQIWHCGRMSHVDFHNGALPVAPSPIKPAGQTWTADGLQEFITPRALSVAEIADVVADYRLATRRALEAGFDGVELHAASGYLPEQFLSSGSNQRLDEYGGSVANRARFVLEEARQGRLKGRYRALNSLLDACPGENIVIGTHGTALSTILNFYNSGFGCDDFWKIIDRMPWIVCLSFEDRICLGTEAFDLFSRFEG